jgi:hypothetical protein
MNSTSEFAKQLVITEQKLKEVYHIHNVSLTDQQKKIQKVPTRRLIPSFYSLSSLFLKFKYFTVYVWRDLRSWNNYEQFSHWNFTENFAGSSGKETKGFVTAALKNDFQDTTKKPWHVSSVPGGQKFNRKCSKIGLLSSFNFFLQKPTDAVKNQRFCVRELYCNVKNWRFSNGDG